MNATKPVAGPTVRRVLELNAATNSRDLGRSLNAAVQLMQFLSAMTPEQRAEMDAYDRQARLWNAEVERLRQAKQARRQAAENARVVRAMRSQACPRCFATHAGEC